MDHSKRRDEELPYISDEKVFEEQKRARRLTQELNTADRADFEKIAGIVKELLGKSEGAMINPPFVKVNKQNVKNKKVSDIILFSLRKVIIDLGGRKNV